jgi:hypothetical protein
VAVSGSTIVATAPDHATEGDHDRGAVYMWTEPASGAWTDAQETTQLIASDGMADTGLGNSVAISGSAVVAGESQLDDGTPDADGRAYVWAMPPGGWQDAPDPQEQTAELRASDGALDDYLGTSVGVSGTTVVVGAPDHEVGGDAGQGAVYVYTEPAGGWANADDPQTETAELTQSDPGGGDHLGESVAVGGSTVAAGAPSNTNSEQGAIYEWTMPAGGWADASDPQHETAELTTSDGDSSGLGKTLSSGTDPLAVSESGTTIVAGDPAYPVSDDPPEEGAVYVWPEPASGGWVTADDDAVIADPNASQDDAFGASVGMSGSTIVAGSPRNSGSPGVAYVLGAGATTVAPSITSATGTTFAIGTAGSFEIQTAGTPDGSAVSLSDGAATLPAGVTFTGDGDGTATLAGTPAAGTVGAYPFTITATNGVSPAATQSFTLTVSDQAPTITSASGTTFDVGAAGIFEVQATGAPGGPTLTLSDGGASLPSGVTFTDNGDATATLSGTPAAGTVGAYPFTITAANGVPPNATQQFTLTVNPSGAPSISSAASTTFTVSAPGTFEVQATGIPAGPTLTLSDGGASLPSGVTFTDNGDATATLSGTPAAGTAGAYPFTITAANGVPPDATQSFTLTVASGSTITTAAPGDVAATSATLNWTVQPAGLDLYYYNLVCTPFNGALPQVSVTAEPPTAAVAADDGSHPLATPITGLLPGNEYRCLLQMGVEGSAAAYASYPSFEDVTTLVPTFEGFSGTPAPTPTAQLTWTIDPEGDALTGYAATCTSSPGAIEVNGEFDAGGTPSGGTSPLSLPITLTGLSPGTTYSCSLKLTDADGDTYSDQPQTVLTTVVSVSTRASYSGGFIAVGGSCGGSACAGSGEVTVDRGHDALATARAAAPRPVVLCRFRFRLKPHSSGKIRFAPTRAGLKLLRRDHRLLTTLTMTVRVRGRTITTSTPLTITYHG